MLERLSTGPRRVRTLFLSDVHLGTRGCQADKLLDFLRHYEADTIYLVGDIVDGWQLKSAWYWPQLHNDVVQKLLRQARKGVRLFYIPGNHDEFLRDYYGTHFGGIEVVEDAVHVAADGKRYLIVHGDLFDVIIRHARWLALLGSNAYDLAIFINTYFNTIRRAFGLTYWSLSKWAKLKVKNAMAFIGEYERTLAAEARRRGRLRPHPSCRDPRRSRLALHQLRRLGRKLHRGGRAFQRTVRDREVDRGWAVDARAGLRGGARLPGVGTRRRNNGKRMPETHSRQPHQWFADANRGVLPHVLMQREAVGGEDDDGRSVLEPTYFLPFPERRVAGDDIGSAMLEAEQHVEKVQADAGDKHGRDRDQRNGVAAGGQSRAQQRAFVLAEQLFDPPQRDRIDVPGVARDISHLIDAAIVRRVETMIHARRQTQRHVAAVAMSIGEHAIAEQLRQGVGKTLDLIETGAGNRTGRAHDRIAGADEDFGIVVDRARSLLELPDEAIVHAAKVRLLRLAQIQIGEEAPQGDRQVAHQRLLDLAEPAHELRGQPAGDPVGEQEIEVLLRQHTQNLGAERHRAVTSFG